MLSCPNGEDAELLTSGQVIGRCLNNIFGCCPDYGQQPAGDLRRPSAMIFRDKPEIWKQVSIPINIIDWPQLNLPTR